jgi:pyridoxamine 5'-phosphate oxidase
MSDALKTLNGTLAAVWSRLEAGATDTNAPANLPVLATSSAKSGPAARIVVLRGVDRAASMLTMFTHAGATKVADLKNDERAELLIWDAPERFQIRLSVTIELIEVDAATWQLLGPGTRLNYAVDPSPGTPIDKPEDAWRATPELHQMLQLQTTIHRIETLHIAPDGLRRAVFEGDTSQWIAP